MSLLARQGCRIDLRAPETFPASCHIPGRDKRDILSDRYVLSKWFMVVAVRKVRSKNDLKRATFEVNTAVSPRIPFSWDDSASARN
jgi:hypothetical protein